MFPEAERADLRFEIRLERALAGDHQRDVPASFAHPAEGLDEHPVSLHGQEVPDAHDQAADGRQAQRVSARSPIV